MLFVYGTLKREGRYHTRFCRYAERIQPATVRGRLYDLDKGYPTLEIPSRSILAHGTSDPDADAILAQQGTRGPTSADGDGDESWDLVYGEVMSFPVPKRDIPPIDRLEGFDPGEGKSLYHRILTAVEVDSGPVHAWLYTAGPELLNSARRIPSGIWPASAAP